jgi:translin
MELIKGLGTLKGPLVAHFEKKDAAREKANRMTREIIRNCSKLIREAHDIGTNATLLKETKARVMDLKKALRGYDELYYSGMVEGALQEFAEAMIFIAIINDRPMPTPKGLGITENSFVLGIGDVIGELRREALLELRRHNVPKAYENLDKMECLYNLLMDFNIPGGLLQVRHKQDVARSLIEKTRGELIIAEATQGLRLQAAGREAGGESGQDFAQGEPDPASKNESNGG